MLAFSFKKLSIYVRFFYCMMIAILRKFFLKSGLDGWSLISEAFVIFMQQRRNEFHLFASMRELMEASDPAPGWIKRRKVIISQTEGDIKGEFFCMHANQFAPKNPERQKVILFLHGGAYCLGSIRSHENIVARISKTTGCLVLAIEYKLAPEFPFPAALEDTKAAYLYLVKKGFREIILMGDSAGGGLAFSTTLALRDMKFSPLPAAIVGVSPWVDLTHEDFEDDRLLNTTYFTNSKSDYLPTENLHQIPGFYTGNNDPRHPYLSPIYGDLKGLPPVLIQAGSCEQLYGDICMFVKKLEASGVVFDFKTYQHMPHAFIAFGPFFIKTQKAFEDIGTFVKNIPTESKASMV